MGKMNFLLILIFQISTFYSSSTPNLNLKYLTGSPKFIFEEIKQDVINNYLRYFDESYSPSFFQWESGTSKRKNLEQISKIFFTKFSNLEEAIYIEFGTHKNVKDENEWWYGTNGLLYIPESEEYFLLSFTTDLGPNSIYKGNKQHYG